MLSASDVRRRQGSSRTRLAAAWIFVLPLVTAGVARDEAKIQVAGLLMLAFAVVIRQQPLPPRALGRIVMTVGVLSLIVMSYLAFRSWPSYAGTARSYDTHAWLFVLTYVVVAVYATLFFDDRLFMKVMWRAATAALWIGVISCAVSRLTGHALLVNANDGGLRMTGTLPEPAEWASILAFVLLLAFRRRSWLYVSLSLAGLFLADSPTCLLVMAVSVILYAVLTTQSPHRPLVLAGVAAAIAGSVVFVQHVNAQPWLDSSNPERIAVGRLVSGIHNVETGGEVGSNDRFASTTVIVADVREHGWALLGAGPEADTTWLPAMYPGPSGTTVAANALWVVFLFDYGITGMAILLVLLAVAAWRMRRCPQMAAILLPFTISCLASSAGPDPLFAALGIMLFGFGWAPQAVSMRPQGTPAFPIP